MGVLRVEMLLFTTQHYRSFGMSLDFGESSVMCSSNGVSKLENIVTRSVDAQEFLLLGEHRVVRMALRKPMPTCSAHDYVQIGSSTTCQLGLRSAHIRRTSSARCVPDRLRAGSSTPCKCTVDDYECAVCYHSKGDQCVSVISVITAFVLCHSCVLSSVLPSCSRNVKSFCGCTTHLRVLVQSTTLTRNRMDGIVVLRIGVKAA